MTDKARKPDRSVGARVLRNMGVATFGAAAALAIRYLGLTMADSLGWTPNPRLVDAATIGLMLGFGGFALSRYQQPQDQPIETPIANRGDTVVVVFRPSTYVDSVRLHKVLIDDQAVATVADGCSVTIPVAPGRHTLRAEIDWCKSNALSFDIRAGERSTFRLAPTATGLLLPLVVLLMFVPRFWIRIRQVGSPESSR